MESLGFSKFRELMDISDQYMLEAEIDGRIDDLLGPYVFFFKKSGDLFGAGEDSRVIFAKMKHPDDELPSGWKKEANFSAHNLKKSVRGEPAQNLFSAKDLKSIKIIDREKVMEALRKDVESLGDKAFPRSGGFKLDLSKFFNTDSDEAPNFVRADEE